MKDQEPKQRSRRDLLKTLALGAAAASAAGMTAGAAKAASAPSGARDEAGYRETEHVRRYYETARG